MVFSIAKIRPKNFTPLRYWLNPLWPKLTQASSIPVYRYPTEDKDIHIIEIFSSPLLFNTFSTDLEYSGKLGIQYNFKKWDNQELSQLFGKQVEHTEVSLLYSFDI